MANGNRILTGEEIELRDELSPIPAYDLDKGDQIVGLVNGKVVAMMVLHTASYGPAQFGVSAVAPGGIEHHLLVHPKEELVRAEGVLDLIKLA
ncbi:hypothetical protein ACWFMI_23720 [Nocardiopsis terrae]|uniref:hypothetical protein n=1 Tax=Streptomyces sp. NPDC057554 TaxID=3350538 RepID=UPI003691452B